MTGKAFVDSNIFIYSLSGDDGLKRETAREIIRALVASHNLYLSSQVLVEVSNVLLRKAQLEPATVIALMNDMWTLPCATINSQIVREALVLATVAQLNFWDALILESAASAGCSTLYSEDLNHGQVIRGVKVVNPFLNQT